jgi:hypothetical protein
MNGTAMSEWRNRCKVYPAADVFPMLSDDELAELGKDIKANGLNQPLVFHFDGEDCWLIDGRNRAAAIELAGLPLPSPPREGSYDDRVMVTTCDPIANIVSANLFRRHYEPSRARRCAGEACEGRSGPRWPSFQRGARQAESGQREGHESQRCAPQGATGERAHD